MHGKNVLEQCLLLDRSRTGRVDTNIANVRNVDRAASTVNKHLAGFRIHIIQGGDGIHAARFEGRTAALSARPMAELAAIHALGILGTLAGRSSGIEDAQDNAFYSSRIHFVSISVVALPTSALRPATKLSVLATLALGGDRTGRLWCVQAFFRSRHHGGNK
jgi:hypothetical protein